MDEENDLTHCCFVVDCEEVVSHEQELIAFAARNATAGRGTGIASSVVCNADGEEVRRVLLFRG